MVFGVVVSMIFLQLSCAAVKKHPVEEPPAAVEAAPEGGGELADAHQSAGISCSNCHAESPPASAVPGDVCLTCHGDYQELTAGSYTDPHNAHIAFADCSDCHHIHRPSENQCLACHFF